MSHRSILLIGGPDSGKSNYVGRLWIALKERQGRLQRIGMPSNIEYVDSICEQLLKGEFSGRTDRSSDRREFTAELKDGDQGTPFHLVVPDFSGELWQEAVRDSELPQEWLDELEKACGALVFVRVHSSSNVQPINWVVARGQLAGKYGGQNNETEIPTQVVLCELLRLLQQRLSGSGKKPRVAVMVTAWDLVDEATRSAGPQAYLMTQFPLFAGAIEGCEALDMSVYGVSIVGGDLSEPDFQRECLEAELSEMGSVHRMVGGRWEKSPDVTLPVAWVIGEQD